MALPQVAYKSPGAYSADWIDLYNRLYRERIIFVGQPIAEDLANQIIAVMLYLEREEKEKPMFMYINSPGGSVPAGFAMFDTMRYVKSDISTINVGLAPHGQSGRLGWATAAQAASEGVGLSSVLGRRY